MRFLRLITFTLCVMSLHAQALREKAWGILANAAQDKSYEKRSKAIHSLGMITGNARARTMAEKALGDGTKMCVSRLPTCSASCAQRNRCRS